MFDSKQDRDCWLDSAETRCARIRYLFFRSAESRAAGTEGQDYLLWREAFGNSLLFAVCDGVGSSFCGNIASSFLARKLIELLDDSGPKMDHMSAIELKEHMLKYLGSWQADGHRLVQREAIQAPPDSLIEKALEQQREEHGSETVFACGRLSFGAEAGRLLLVWMGDCEMRVFDQRGREIQIAEAEDRVASDRWSTRWGARKKGSRLHTRVVDLQQQEVARALVHTDGLSTISERLADLGEDELHRAVLDLVRSPKSDDISFIDLVLKPPPEETDLDAPVVGVESSAERVRLHWSAVGGAEAYEVEVADDGLFLHPKSMANVEDSELELEPYDGTRFFRVRGLADKKVGAWSQGLRCQCVARPEISCDGDGGFLLRWQSDDDIELCVITEITEGRPNRVFLEPAANQCWLAPDVDPGRYFYEVEFVSRRGVVSEPSRRLMRRVPGLLADSDAPLESDPDEILFEEDAPRDAPDERETGEHEAIEPIDGPPVSEVAASDEAADSLRHFKQDLAVESLDPNTAIDNLHRPRNLQTTQPSSGSAAIHSRVPNTDVEEPSGGVNSDTAIRNLEATSSVAHDAKSFGLTRAEGMRNLESGIGSSSRFDEARSERRKKQPQPMRRRATTPQGGVARLPRGPRPIDNPKKVSRFIVSGEGIGREAQLWESDRPDVRTAQRVREDTAQFLGDYWLVCKRKVGTYYYWIQPSTGRPDNDAQCVRTEVCYIYPCLECHAVRSIRFPLIGRPSGDCEIRLRWTYCQGVNRFRLHVLSRDPRNSEQIETQARCYLLKLQPGSYEVVLEPLGSDRYLSTRGTIVIRADTNLGEPTFEWSPLR